MSIILHQRKKSNHNLTHEWKYWQELFYIKERNQTTTLRWLICSCGRLFYIKERNQTTTHESI